MLSVSSTPILLKGEPTGPHREGDHVHRAPLHGPREDLPRPAVAFLGRHPVVRRSGVFAQRGADVGQVFGSGDVVDGRAVIEAAGQLFLVQAGSLRPWRRPLASGALSPPPSRRSRRSGPARTCEPFLRPIPAICGAGSRGLPKPPIIGPARPGSPAAKSSVAGAIGKYCQEEGRIARASAPPWRNSPKQCRGVSVTTPSGEITSTSIVRQRQFGSEDDWRHGWCCCWPTLAGWRPGGWRPGGSGLGPAGRGVRPCGPAGSSWPGRAGRPGAADRGTGSGGSAVPG